MAEKSYSSTLDVANKKIRHLTHENNMLKQRLNKCLVSRQNMLLSLDNANHALTIKSKNLQHVSSMSKFLKSRIRQCFGNEGYLKVMAHVNAPGGFDIENYKKVNEIKQ